MAHLSQEKMKDKGHEKRNISQQFCIIYMMYVFPSTYVESLFKVGEILKTSMIIVYNSFDFICACVSITSNSSS